MKNYKKFKLSDAYWFQEGPGVRNTQFRDEGTKLLNVANITKSGILDLSKTSRYLNPQEVASKYSHFLVDPGDLVIASSGISFDSDGLLRTRGAFVSDEHLPLCMNTSTIRFKARENISDLRFLKYWLQSQEFRTQITRLVTGSAQKNFGPSHLKSMEITLPPFDEQIRISYILEKADGLRELHRQAISKAEELLTGVFLDMFGDPVENPYSWSQVAFDDLLEALEGGWSPVCLDRQAALDEWGVLKLGAITQCIYLESENKALPESQSPRPAIEVKPGDLLFSRKNTHDLVAACALVETTRNKLMMPDLIFRFRLKQGGICLPEYLWALLTNASKRKQVQQLAGGTSGSMPNISKEKLRKLQIEVPPIGKQREFAMRFHRIRHLQKQTLSSFQSTEQLFVSLQSQLLSADSGSSRELQLHV